MEQVRNENITIQKMQEEINALKQEIVNLKADRNNVESGSTHKTFSSSSVKPQKRRKRSELAHHPIPRELDMFGEPIINVNEEENKSNNNVVKAICILVIGVAIMALLMHTGLLIPIGLIGLAAGGLLK